MKLPWVGWYSPNGIANLSTWSGAARCVVVTNVPAGWHPASGVPDGSEVLEIPEAPRMEQVQCANNFNGRLVIVFDTFPVQPRRVML